MIRNEYGTLETVIFPKIDVSILALISLQCKSACFLRAWQLHSMFACMNLSLIVVSNIMIGRFSKCK